MTYRPNLAPSPSFTAGLADARLGITSLARVASNDPVRFEIVNGLRPDEYLAGWEAGQHRTAS